MSCTGGFTRREFCTLGLGALGGVLLQPTLFTVAAALATKGARVVDARPGEDVFAYMARRSGGFDPDLYRRVAGAANAFKEGDRIIGVAALDDEERAAARGLLAATRVGDLCAHSLLDDPLYSAIVADLNPATLSCVSALRLGELRERLLQDSETDVCALLDGLSSDVIACLVKLLSDEELVALGSRIHHALPGTMIGARGYLGARIQPNSPTDNPEDIFWQVLSGFSFAVGDVVLGTNPVSSDPDSVAVLERTLLDIRRSFGIEELLPHSVLAHIDIQAMVEERDPGTTGIWFQSLAGSERGL